MRIPKKAKIWCNSIFLLGSLLVVAAWSGVTYKPDYVNSLGNDVIKRYVERHANSQADALKALDQGSTGLAFELLDDWQQVFKGDRLYPLKRMLYNELSDQLDAADRGREMKQVAEQWMAENERDIAARAYYWQALTKDAATKEAGIAGLAREFSNFPNSQTLRWFYEKAVLATLSTYEERQEFWAVQQAQAEPAWQVFWDTGGGFSASQSTSPIAPLREQNGEWSIKVKIPASSSNLRLDLPPDSRLRLSNLALWINQVRTLLDPTTLRTHMFQPQGDWLQTTGGNDPYVSLSLGDLLPAETGLVSVKVSFMLARGGVTAISKTAK